MLDFVGSRKTEDAGNPIVGVLKPALGANFSSWGMSETTTLHARPQASFHPYRPAWLTVTPPVSSEQQANAHCSPLHNWIAR